MERNFCWVVKVELYEGDSGGLGRPIEYMDETETVERCDDTEDW